MAQEAIIPPPSDDKHDGLTSPNYKIINNLPENEFWDLVSLRLNTAISKNQIAEGILPDITTRELWTEERLIEEIFLKLALTKQIIKHHHIDEGNNDVTIPNHCYGFTTYKYYNQARILRQWIPISKPAPKFVVDASDLTIRLIIELKALGEDGAQYVLKEAVGRIFENIGARQYHLSIARNLEVVLKP
jgi:hypothetical protein